MTCASTVGMAAQCQCQVPELNMGCNGMWLCIGNYTKSEYRTAKNYAAKTDMALAKPPGPDWRYM